MFLDLILRHNGVSSIGPECYIVSKLQKVVVCTFSGLGNIAYINNEQKLGSEDLIEVPRVLV